MNLSESAFEARLRQNYDELKWLYCELYHNDENAFSYFIEMLRRSYAARSPALRILDESRVAHPDWYRANDLIGMMLYVDAYAGDLHGLLDKIPYWEECGINYIHLMPLLKTVKGRSDGGYAVADFRTVQPELGTMEDLERLSEACHAHGICLCLDFVMNHTSEDHPWARAARAGDPTARARYFFYDSWDIPNQYEETVPQVFPTTAPGNFTWLDDCKQVVMTFFYPYQWDLNYANPMVFNDMTENLLYLTARGIDIIRLDAVPYIWKALGTDCRNLPQVHTLTRMMRLACEIVCPGVLLLGEVVMEPKELAPYFGTTEKPECHMLYNATTMCTTWHTVATQDTRLLRHQMDQLAQLPREYVFLNYLRCHDDIGWGLDYPFLRQFGMEEVPHKQFLNAFFAGEFPGSFSRGERYNDDPTLGDARMCGTTASLCGIESALSRNDDDALRLAADLDLTLHAFVLSQSGIPIIYAGDEVGQFNDYSYHFDPDKADDSRYIHRGKFDWKTAEERDDKTSWRWQLFHGLRRMEEIRKRYDVFSASAEFSTFDPGDTRVLGLRRAFRGQVLLALFNFIGAELTVTNPDFNGAVDLLDEQAMVQDPVALPPYGFKWLLKEI